MAGTGLVLICVFMDLNLVSVHEKATKKDFFGSLPKLRVYHIYLTNCQ